MAMDSTDAFTLGALKNAPGGNGVRLLHLAGQLSGLDGTGTYTVSPEGAVVGSGGGADGDLVMTDGAGCIVTVTAYDVDATGVAPEGAVATVKFTFGSTVGTGTTDGTLQLLGGFFSGGFDIGGGTTVDNLTFGCLAAISGNSITFHIAAPYEQEGGTQIAIDANTTLIFSIGAYAAGDTI